MKRPGEKLGMSIKGGARSIPGNPLDSTDEGVFISKVLLPFIILLSKLYINCQRGGLFVNESKTLLCDRERDRCLKMMKIAFCMQHFLSHQAWGVQIKIVIAFIIVWAVINYIDKIYYEKYQKVFLFVWIRSSWLER